MTISTPNEHAWDIATRGYDTIHGVDATRVSQETFPAVVADWYLPPINRLPPVPRNGLHQDETFRPGSR